MEERQYVLGNSVGVGVLLGKMLWDETAGLR